MVYLSAFADEISANPKEQAACLQENSIGFIEFRSIHSTNVLDLTPAQHQAFRDMLTDRGIRLSAIASPIGKSSLQDPPERDLARLETALQLASDYGARNIRVFSFYPPDGETVESSRDEVLSRMLRMTRMAEGRGIRLVLENEKALFGDTAHRIAQILEAIPSESLGLAFDPANFLEVGQDIDEAWSLLRDRVVHFHVKDYDVKLKKNVVAGQGGGQIGRLIAEAVATGYDGFCTLEPHLLVAGHSHGFTGPERFGDAARALKSELDLRSVAYR